MKTFLLSFLLFGIMNAKKVPVYYLNADYDYRNMMDWSKPDIDCLHTVGDPIPFPEKVTVCVRNMHMTYSNPVASSYAHAFGFGTYLDDWTELKEGFFYGEWETGPWWGYKTKEKTAAGSYGWVGLGDNGGSDHGVWTHTCTVIDFTNGRTASVENGVKFFDKEFEALIPAYKGFVKQIKTVSAGCVYKLGTTPHMSIHGKVTDFQMWNKILSDEDMIKITSCEKFKSGNLLDWETGNWFLNSSRGTARMEMMDLQSEICAPRTSSLHLIPYKLSFEPESLHMCTKFSGKIATYTKKKKFDEITRFLSSKQHMKTGDCTKKIKDKEAWRFRTWVGNDDYEQEGIFQDWYTDELVEYTPWADERPYVGGTKYNCMVLQIHLEDSGAPKARMYDVTVNDEECDVGFCNLCEVPTPSRKMVVRGLCGLSMFDKVYQYVINEDGQPMYIGSRTSVLYYDKEKIMWVWYDRKSSKSVATSISSEASLLMGVHNVDFSGLIDDKCYTGGSKEKKIKLTTCSYGEFTCNDGQCIDIEQRCDQTSNCLDESDEDGCRLMYMKDNYNKKIAPFIFDKVNNKNIPVNVNASMSVIDIVKIAEVDHTFTLKFRLVLEWYDYRIKYYNLKTSRSANALAIEEVQKLWIPFLVFDNTENNEATKGTEDTELTLSREGDFIGSEDTVVEEINIFEGKFNRITFEQVFTKTFKCVYKLQLYPFDTQVCKVNLIVRKLETAVMMVTPSMLAMESETVLTQYIIKNWTLAYNNKTDPDAGIRMEIVLKRRIMNSILTVYLPTLLILTIVYATNFFKDFFFEAVVTVNLTALLVLTTLFISVSSSLPLTAYVKMVDIWLIFAQVIPWIEVLLHTLTDMMRSEGEEGREINHHGKTITVGGAGDGSTESLPTEDELIDQVYPIKSLYPQFEDDVSVIKMENKQNTLRVDSALHTDYNKMTQRDEEQLVDARKQFYENAKVDTDIVAKLQFLTKKAVPMALVAFSALYWTYGLSYYFSDEF